MPRTIKRQPFTVSTNENAYPKTNVFTQAEFKGLVDTKNDVTVDQYTFSDALNVCVDDVNRLVSRPPFVRKGTAENIIKQWVFGHHKLSLIKENTHSYSIVCTSHTVATDMGDARILVDVSSQPEDYVPEIFCIPIEDKVFIWCEGIKLYCFNLLNEPYFEDATKYLYLPIKEVITNSIVTENETKNFLTEAYIRRHLLSAISDVRLERLYGKSLRVNLHSVDTQNASTHLYDATVSKAEKSNFIYPYMNVGTDYIIDIVRTPNTFVFLRYHVVFETIEISFDGKSYRTLPTLDGIVGKPSLTRDGMGVAVFTRNGLAMCKIVAQESEDFSSDNDVFVWTFRPYFERAIEAGVSLSTAHLPSTHTPIGYFKTLYQFAYIVFREYPNEHTNYTPTLYTEWSSADGIYWAHKMLEEFTRDGWNFSAIDFEYAMPTTSTTMVMPIGAFVATGSGVFGIQSATISKVKDREDAIFSGDNISFNPIILDIDDPYQRKPFIYKLDADAKFIVKGEAIQSGDNILLSYIPLELSSLEAVYDNTRVYSRGDYVVYSTFDVPRVYRSLRDDNTGEIYNPDMWALTDIPVYPENNAEKIPWHVALLISKYPSTGYYRYTQRAVIKKISETSSDKIIHNNDKISISAENKTVVYNGNDVWTAFRSYDTREEMTYPLPALDREVNVTAFGPETYNVRFNKIINPAYIDLSPFEFRPMSPRVENCDIITRNIRAEEEKLEYEHIISLDDDVYKFFCEKNLSTGAFSLGVEQVHRFSGVKSIILSPSGVRALTDKGLAIDGELTNLPENGRLSKYIDDHVQNDCYIKLLSPDDEIEQRLLPSGFIHAVDSSTKTLTSKRILAGTENNDVVLNYGTRISKVNVSSSHQYSVYAYTDTGPYTGVPKSGQLVYFYDRENNYPDAPADWKVGDEWPTIGQWQYIPKPLISVGLTEKRVWSAEEKDSLPTGPIIYSGYLSIERYVEPLYVDEECVWYNISGEIWRSYFDEENIVELDEYVNADVTLSEDGSMSISVEPANVIPTHYNVLNEYYISFDDGDRQTLEISQTKYDERSLFEDTTSVRLLYLPLKNEHVFPSKITNIHPLSDTDMGVFTENEVWYTSRVIIEDGTYYTRAIKSRLPIGCREGDEILTAPDGQSLILCTARGITTISPQDFVATTDKALTYLSDTIQNTYYNFYNEHLFDYTPQIKMIVYRYWIFFYKYMDNILLLLDTRNGTFWPWKTPYPIRELSVDTRLHVLFHINLSDGQSKNGVPFLLADEEVDTLSSYGDYIIDNALSGEKIYTDHVIKKLAEPQIDWYITSQRLHFGQINNYKAIKSLYINVQSDNVFGAQLSTKIYRDLYHPERNTTINVEVDDLRTFVKRCNFIHALYFQYFIRNDPTEITQAHQLKLNSLGVKYEIKERIK